MSLSNKRLTALGLGNYTISGKQTQQFLSFTKPSPVSKIQLGGKRTQEVAM
jgi:hypothetical protein